MWLDSFAVGDFGTYIPNIVENILTCSLSSKDLVVGIERRFVHAMTTHSPGLVFLLVSNAKRAKSLEALSLCATESLPCVDWHHRGC